jgi:hypothetical protein
VKISTWLFVVSPLPVRFFWPVVVLPALVASFLAEASKFLFYDTSICRKTVWFPPGTESLPRTAECSLGSTAIYGIASGIIFLICLILVCIKAPNRRELEPNYGLDVENGNMMEIANPGSYFERERDPHAHISRPPVGNSEYYEGDGESGVTSINSRGYESGSGYDSSTIAKSGVQSEPPYDDDDLLSQQRSTGDGGTGDPHKPLKMPATDVTIIRDRSGGNPPIVSQSRLETVERMAQNANSMSHTSAVMIDQFLTDLDKSFQADSSQNENN